MTHSLTSLSLLPASTSAGQGQWFDLGDQRGHVLLSSAQTGGLLFLDLYVDAFAQVPPHIHEREDEIFYILEGHFVLTANGETIHAQPGDTVFGPRGVAHSWRCESETGGRMLVLANPGANFEAFVLQMSNSKIFPSNPAMLPAFLELAQAHGLQMLPPA